MRHAKVSLVLKGFDTSYRACIEEDIMVGERDMREPKEKSYKWQRRSKVWNILKKGESQIS